VLPENRGDLLEAVRWAAAGPLQIDVKAPETVTMSLYSQPGGNRILHLINYDEGHPASDIDVILQLAEGKSGATVSLLSPDFEGARSLTAEQTGRALHFTVPRLEIYSMIVVE
jgi:hypothetical protein